MLSRIAKRTGLKPEDLLKKIVLISLAIPSK